MSVVFSTNYKAKDGKDKEWLMDSIEKLIKKIALEELNELHQHILFIYETKELLFSVSFLIQYLDIKELVKKYKKFLKKIKFDKTEKFVNLLKELHPLIQFWFLSFLKALNSKNIEQQKKILKSNKTYLFCDLILDFVIHKEEYKEVKEFILSDENFLKALEKQKEIKKNYKDRISFISC